MNSLICTYQKIHSNEKTLIAKFIRSLPCFRMLSDILFSSFSDYMNAESGRSRGEKQFPSYFMSRAHETGVYVSANLSSALALFLERLPFYIVVAWQPNFGARIPLRRVQTGYQRKSKYFVGGPRTITT